ncbi:DUF3592 domain-containing protein [Flavonifractor sp. An100]|uniref:DUF3592 domain-containing protein n=1 Tax=Flavonifractor sp. An100 TaxID=1965538 RepID=UPI000B39CD68|nr:DUF3592 domain-containing protein [Flavonifractor sp. An100]OUQ82377.1 hypothetical protein B5E43_00960 [Flavonifractor sp. An100]
MRDLLVLIGLAIGVGLMGMGLGRSIRYGRRRAACTSRTIGHVAEVLEERSLLYWPDQLRKVPVICFSPEGSGGMVTTATLYADSNLGRLNQGQQVEVRYSPRQPECCLIAGWDEAYVRTALAQILVGAVILILTLRSLG